MYGYNTLGCMCCSGMHNYFGGYRGYAANNQLKLFAGLESRLGVGTAIEYTGFSKGEVEVAAEAKEFVQQYTREMTALQNAASDVLGEGSRNVAASSSDTAVLEGNVTWKTAAAGEYQIDVLQLAEKQVNRSAEYEAAGANSLATGEFQLTTGKGQKAFDMSSYSGKGTNGEALAALALDINRAGLGVTASTVQKDGKTALVLESAEIGGKNSFQVAGSSAVASGASQPTQAAQDAVYKVNGKEYTSSSNKIELDTYKVDVTLKKTGSAKLTVGADIKETVKKVSKLVDSYNKAITFLNNNSEKGSGVSRQIKNMLRLPVSEDTLRSVGVTVNADGTMSLDENKLMTSLTENPRSATEAISGSYSLAQGLKNDAAQGLGISSSNLTDAMRTTKFTDKIVIIEHHSCYTYGRSTYSTLLNYNNMGALLNTLI